jgi:hypothetical protein
MNTESTMKSLRGGQEGLNNRIQAGIEGIKKAHMVAELRAHSKDTQERMTAATKASKTTSRSGQTGFNNSGQGDTKGIEKALTTEADLRAHNKETREREAVVNKASTTRTRRGGQAGLNNCKKAETRGIEKAITVEAVFRVHSKET